MREKKSLELYLHVPFCVQKCNYCDFLSAPATGKTREAYVKTLIREIKEKSNMCQDYSVPSLFFGGGTPSVLLGESIEEILEAVRESFFLEETAEITIECNPGTLNEKKAAHYKRAGINRISLGVQSVHEQELKLLGRIHTWEDVLESCDILRKAGFRNLNLDLMSGLPGQTLEQWQDTLHGAVALHPEHISAYSLIVEEGTPFYQKYGEDERCRQAGEDTRYLPDEETERQMYQWTCSYLKEHGFVQYEISNYAKPGRECRHNIGYWTGAEYLGLGLGSASLFGGKRFSNTRELSEYLAGDFEPREVEVLSRTAQMEEFVFLGLRMCRGISRAEFAARFGVEMEAVYGQELAQLCSQGLLKQEAGFVALTREGVSVSNYVMAKFIK